MIAREGAAAAQKGNGAAGYGDAAGDGHVIGEPEGKGAAFRSGVYLSDGGGEVRPAADLELCRALGESRGGEQGEDEQQA